MDISVILNNKKVYDKTIGFKEVFALVMILLVIGSGNVSGFKALGVPMRI